MKAIGWILMLLPTVFISIMYWEAGLFGLMIYGFYIFAALCTFVAPIIGLTLIKRGKCRWMRHFNKGSS